MKKVISIILCSLTILISLALIAEVIFSIVDLHREYIRITTSPGFSGADLLGGIVATVAVAFFVFCGSAVVTILSLINMKIAEIRFIRVFSAITAMLMGIICFISLFCLFGAGRL